MSTEQLRYRADFHRFLWPIRPPPPGVPAGAPPKKAADPPAVVSPGQHETAGRQRLTALRASTYQDADNADRREHGAMGGSKRGNNGSALVVQTRSPIGSSRKHRQTLRSLGLGKIGKAKLLNISDPSIAGMIVAVSHLVEVRDPSDGATGVRVGGNGIHLITRDYGVDGTLARFFKAGSDEYACVEADEQSVSIGWSSKLKIDESLAALRVSYLPKELPGAQAVVYAGQGDEHFHLPTSEALDYAHTNSSCVRAFRAEFTQLTFSWRMPLPHLGEGARYARIVLELDECDEVSLTQILEDSATSEIGRRAPDIAMRARSIFLHAQAQAVYGLGLSPQRETLT
ncbi:50S ribosomal protein L30 [Streptomyces sviceus]|uniref:50S ribosomal protein L30 n=1 Tax=Streptomyces sviceus TaxID=285530 RepID=UPI0036827F47